MVGGREVGGETGVGRGRWVGLCTVVGKGRWVSMWKRMGGGLGNRCCGKRKMGVNEKGEESGFEMFVVMEERKDVDRVEMWSRKGRR